MSDISTEHLNTDIEHFDELGYVVFPALIDRFTATNYGMNSTTSAPSPIAMEVSSAMNDDSSLTDGSLRLPPTTAQCRPPGACSARTSRSLVIWASRNLRTVEKNGRGTLISRTSDHLSSSSPPPCICKT